MSQMDNDTLLPAALVLVFVLAFAIVFWSKYDEIITFNYEFIPILLPLRKITRSGDSQTK